MTVLYNVQDSHSNITIDEISSSTVGLNYNAIFDTGCKRLQSFIEMQPKMEMQPTDKLELAYLFYLDVNTNQTGIWLDECFKKLLIS